MGPRWHLSFLLMVASSCLSCIGCTDSTSVTPATPATDSAASVWFRPLPTDSGFDFVHSLGSKRRYWIPETVSGGVALLDYDGDGDLDVLSAVAWDDKEIRIFFNDQGVFERSLQVISGKGIYSGAVADMDGDGDLDIVGEDRYAQESSPWFYERE